MAMYYEYDDILLERSTFVRERDRIVIDCVGSMAIEVTFQGAPPQTIRFSDPVKARFFLNDLECEFARDGWTLAESELADRAARRPEFTVRARA